VDSAEVAYSRTRRWPETSEPVERAPGGLSVQELQCGETLQRLADCDLPLEPRQRTAKACMSICTER
jgi:hypothetical protein